VLRPSRRLPNVAETSKRGWRRATLHEKVSLSCWSLEWLFWVSVTFMN
jgi:hypothetical protein